MAFSTSSFTTEAGPLDDLSGRDLIDRFLIQYLNIVSSSALHPPVLELVLQPVDGVQGIHGRHIAHIDLPDLL